MSVKRQDLEAELQRVRFVREELWQKVNQAIGAERQLEAIIAAWDQPQDSPEPKSPEVPQ